LGHGRLSASKTSRQTEESNPQVDEIEMSVQIQLDGTEVAETSEACDSHQGIDRSKSQTKPPHPICVVSETGPKTYGAADEVKHVMGGRECEVEHFVAKESQHANHQQNCSAQYDIDLCQRAAHFYLATLPWREIQIQSQNFVELTARANVASSPLRAAQESPASDTRSVKQIGEARIGKEPRTLGRSEMDWF
jgi:hypothetical protein